MPLLRKADGGALPVKDPDLGYTQGMCFAAAVVCMGNSNLESKHKRFGGLMRNLRH